MQKNKGLDQELYQANKKAKTNVYNRLCNREVENTIREMAYACIEQLKKDIYDDVRDEYITMVDFNNRKAIQREYQHFLDGIRIDSFEKYCIAHDIDWKGMNGYELIMTYQNFIRQVHKIAVEDLTEEDEIQAMDNLLSGLENEKGSD